MPPQCIFAENFKYLTDFFTLETYIITNHKIYNIISNRKGHLALHYEKAYHSYNSFLKFSESNETLQQIYDLGPS